MGAEKGQLQDLMFILGKLCGILVGPFLQPVDTSEWQHNPLVGLSDSMFLPACLPLLPSFVFFLLVSEFSQELLVHPCSPPATTACFPGSGDGSFLSLEDMNHYNQLGMLDCCSLQNSVP